MTTAPYPQVTNELLSAYIDEAVSEEERRLIESAVAHDPDVAWRLESLRATVRLLRELPARALPRSFLLTAEQIGQAAEGAATPAAPAPRQVIPAAPARKVNQPAADATDAAGGFWQEVWRGWQQFWQGGSPALRNAMAASFAVLLVLLLAPRFLAPPALPGVGAVQTVANSESAPTAVEAAVSEDLTANEVTASEENFAGSEDVAQAVPTVAVETESGAGARIVAEDAAAASAVAEDAAAEGAVAESAESMAAAKIAGEPGASTAEAAADAGSATPLLAAESAEPAMSVAAAAVPAEAPAGAAAMPTLAPGQPAPQLEAGVPGLEGAGGGSSGIDQMRQADGSAPAPAMAAEAAPAAAEAMPAAATPAADTASEAAAEVAAAEDSADAEVLPEPAPTATASLVVAPVEAAAESAGPSTEAYAAGVDAAAVPAAAPAGAAAQPGWPALALQALAALAAAATLVFATLWWRSRRGART